MASINTSKLRFSFDVQETCVAELSPLIAEEREIEATQALSSNVAKISNGYRLQTDSTV